MSYGLTFGGSQTYLHGRVSNIYRPSDIEGVYGAAGAGATIIRGPQAIILSNQKGAVLELSGRQTGLLVNLDVSGMRCPAAVAGGMTKLHPRAQRRLECAIACRF